MRGKPKLTCRATAKSTGERCRRAPIPGGTVCIVHGGGTTLARAAGERRLAEAEVERQMARWERREEARRLALSAWSDEAALRMSLALVDPSDLRRVAGVMTRTARVLRAAAGELEQSTPRIRATGRSREEE